MPRKIHIIGSVGSGKSTLARRLSAELNIPYYETDNLMWRRAEHGPDIRNSLETRVALLNEAIDGGQWIIEGVHYKWLARSFEEAELIVYLDTPIWRRNYRILKRFIVQKLGFERGNYKQTFRMLRSMYVWNYGHARVDKPIILDVLAPYREKLLILEDNTDLGAITNRPE